MSAILLFKPTSWPVLLFPFDRREIYDRSFKRPIRFANPISNRRSSRSFPFQRRPPVLSPPVAGPIVNFSCCDS
ncbi:hypothetical protein DLM77_19850 [Leptospira yasudae]|uniref:Uncharacterized protein n=1 Tax=Leptospira yasudae TaxID=2202201 RepID=A0ABX9LYP8_9LEPT|nr:hypothetical protein DLM77_19850 [Leptospira yasudae]